MMKELESISTLQILYYACHYLQEALTIEEELLKEDFNIDTFSPIVELRKKQLNEIHDEIIRLKNSERFLIHIGDI